MANPFKKIGVAFKTAGLFLKDNRQIIYAFTPAGHYAQAIENAVAVVEQLKRSGNAPESSAGKREKAREIARAQSEDAKRTTNRALDFQIEIERLKQKYPEYIQ